MKLQKTDHISRPWRIHEITNDFRIEDVWALPTPGGPDDLERLVRQMTEAKDLKDLPLVIRVLFAIRWKLGGLLGLDRPGAAVGARVPSLRDRLPADLRDISRGPDPGGVPFTSLYLTDDEWAAETANRTVHGVMHIGWVQDESGGHRGQMAVLVKPNGLLGRLYMAAIAPFRYLVVYPMLMRSIGRRWQLRAEERP
jgi:hypothetical protein